MPGKLSRLVPYPSVRRELKAAAAAMRRALRSLRMERSSGSGELRRCNGVKVNVGCGKLSKEGWINVDRDPGPGAFYLDVVNGLPFGPGTVTHIHCEHFLEHLVLDDANRFLGECYRVLIPGGTVRIIVPDAEKYITAYCRDDQAFFGKLARLGYENDDGTNPDLDTPIKVINQMFRMGGGHEFAWDFATLCKAAKGAGFSEVTRSAFGDIAGDLAIDGTDEWRKVESLYAGLRK